VNVERVLLPQGDKLPCGLIRTAGMRYTVHVAFTYYYLGEAAINGPETLVLTHDKYLTMLKLMKCGVPMPRTYLALSEESALNAARRVGVPVILKPVDGSWGRFVSLVKSLEELPTVISNREFTDNPSLRVHLVQEYVDKPGRDIRVTVVGNRAVAAIYRVSNDWRTNTARGGRAVPAQLDPELEDIAVRASLCLGAVYSGVDVVESSRGYLVLEVNGVPEFKNVQRVTGVNVAGEIVEEVLTVVKR